MYLKSIGNVFKYFSEIPNIHDVVFKYCFHMHLMFKYFLKMHLVLLFSF